MKNSFSLSGSVFLGLLYFALNTGCTDITEFDNLVCGTITVYSEDFTVVAQLQGIEEARKLLIYPGFVFVVKGDGYIDKYSSETLELLGSYKIGQPSPAGYYHCAFSPSESSLYVVGSVGNIIEVSIPDCSVVDDFNVCASPVHISASNTNPAYLYISSGTSNTVWAVKASTNNPVDSWEFPGGITCIEASESDTTLVSTEYGTYRLQFLTAGGLTAIGQLSECLLAIEYFPWYECFAAVNAYQIGIVKTVIDPATLLPFMFFGYEFSIEGYNHILACDNDRYAYVLSYLGENMSRIVKYDMAWEQIVEQFDLNGIPLDMDVSGSGLIYVLTMEN